MLHLTTVDLEAGLTHILDSPKQFGTLDLIVCRPAEDERQVLEGGFLDLAQGLIGDSWSIRPSISTPDRSPHPLMQLNIMNSRVISLVSGSSDRWQLAGDQLYVDLDLSEENLPAGSRLAIGDAVIEVTEVPHRGCQKFSRRFGIEALKFVNSEVGKSLRLRGLNARVVVPGAIRQDDSVAKL